MKREGAIGAAALLALAAAVGISVQPGSRQVSPEGTHGRGSPVRHTKGNGGECDELRKHLEEFLNAEGRLSPTPCEQSNLPRLPAEETAHLKIVIATLPDPLHTHLAVSFDESVAAIQEAAQDEGYDFDSSWLPWQQEQETSYTHLEDQKTADQEKEDRENQPGLLLFRRTDVDGDEPRDSAKPSSPSTPVPSRTEQSADKRVPANEPQLNPQQNSARPPKAGDYRHGLIIFVVGEDATHGIHRPQFQNALLWIAMIGGEELGQQGRLAILGPSFSGSFPSLAELLSRAATAKQLGLAEDASSRPLPIYAGGVSGTESATWFQHQMDEKYGQAAPQVVFHSFVANDDQMVERFLDYLEGAQQHFDYRTVAVLSEDETAYGQDVMRGSAPPKDVLRLYYPRDISAVREAYQSKSLFDNATSEGSQTQLQKALPTDLADPAGIVHDSVHTYGANQTPLAQEAFLLEIVTSLRERGVRYVLLRGSNPLDQLFLTNFLRRLYPDARVVIMTSDLLFIRERGATGLSGVMTLSTYPLSPLARQWTKRSPLAPSDRLFSSDGSEGLYNAFRLLINADLPDQALPNPCHVAEPAWGTDPRVWRHTAESESNIFLPTVVCTRTPIADYAPPLWVNSSSCASTDKGPICSYPGPVVWLSVIGVNRFWPLLPLTSKSAPEIGDPDENSIAAEKKLELPLSMKLFLTALLGFSIFHLWCCWQGSYMAKPAFRAHFAASGDPKQSALIWLGSSVVIFLGLTAAWSCGVFARPTIVMPDSLLAHSAAVAVVLLAWFACLLHYYLFDQLNPEERTSGKSSGSSDRPESAPQKPARETLAAATYRRLRSWASTPLYRIFLTGLFPLLSALFFARLCIIPLESALGPENRVLTYWRSMNLWSGLSPVVPFFSLFIGLYVVFWYALHGLALFGPDRPRLPRAKQLEVPIIHPAKPAEPNPSNPPAAEKLPGEDKDDTLVLRMFTQDTADEIEFAGKPMTPARRFRTRPKNKKEQAQVRLVVKLPLTAFVFVLSGAMAAGFAAGVPIRSLGRQNYAIVFLVWFLFCAGLMTALCWRMYATWAALRQLLEYLDRLPLRRTMEAVRGFSWGNVWKMSGNVLEVRYKLISRQMESMNHTIASLDKLNFCHESLATPEAAATSRKSLGAMREAGQDFAKWYLDNYTNPDAGDLHYFRTFQKRVANVCGCLLRNILLPAWKDENHSLILASPPESETQGTERPAGPPAKEELLRNAEEFVCLTYMGFVQNILGRLRTMAVSIVALFVACCAAISAYPFDPRQALSGVLIALFGVSFASILFVYAGMHRDATLSRVTNTTPGELGSEFWVKLLVFVAPPLLGLLARVFPGITDFLFSWLQPGISSLK